MRAFIFPGQGSQSVGMGKALAEASPVARHLFEEVDEALGQSLSRLMAEGPIEELTLTENAQPAIMANALATLRIVGIDIRQGGFRRRPQPRRIYRPCRGQVVRRGDRRQAAEAARMRDAGGGAGGAGGDGGFARREPRHRPASRRGGGPGRNLRGRQ